MTHDIGTIIGVNVYLVIHSMLGNCAGYNMQIQYSIDDQDKSQKMKLYLQKYCTMALKIIVYLTLLGILVTWLFIPQVTTFFKGGETMSSRLESLDDKFPMPLFILCLEPGTKSNLSQYYGYGPLASSIFYDKNNIHSQWNMTELEMYDNLTFSILKDFNVSYAQGKVDAFGTFQLLQEIKHQGDTTDEPIIAFPISKSSLLSFQTCSSICI